MGSCLSCSAGSVDAVEPPAMILELFRLVKMYFTEEGFQKGANFKPESTDVIISTASKCGTTWMQQICHGLRSGGDMSFEEICLVVPCLEMAHDYGYTDLQAQQPFEPRMYKTHMWYPACPKGAGKYIIVARSARVEGSWRCVDVRCPSDAALSFYHFLENWKYTADELTPDEFIEWFYLKMGAPRSDTEMAGQFHHIGKLYVSPNDSDKSLL